MAPFNLYQNTQFSIYLKDKFQDDIDRFILEEWNDFILAKKGIYTIEGKNRAGKSILIKMILGILPPSIEGRNEQNVSINGKNVNITRVSDAYRNGLCAVFQDDTLIPTMTIREQIYLRHTTKHKLSNYLWSFWYVFVVIFFKGIIEHTLGLLIRPIENVSEQLTPSKDKFFPESKLDPKIRHLLAEFELNEDILSKYPSQLSGGTIAKVRIINALLTENIQILFLDEALNAVAKADCDKIIDTIKNWSYHNDKTVVVVTHKHDEVFRWQPNERFFIKNKRIFPVNNFEYDALDTGVQLSNNFIAKFKSILKAKDYLLSLKKPHLILIDKSVADLTPVVDLLNIIGIKGRTEDCGFFQLEITENTKSIEEFQRIMPRIVSYFPKVEGTIIIIGGGTVLNFCSFIAATLHRGLINHIIVPTTLMAIADVAIGSKASLNIEINKNGISQKHSLGTYTNPHAIIMDSEFVSSLPILQKLFGLSECLKHGLLQDIDLFNQVIDLIGSTNPDSNKCFEVGLTTQEIKSRTLVTDPYELTYGRVLLYGHLHAHSLERLKELTVPHGLSVFWGILLDLKLAADNIIFRDVLNVVKNSAVGIKLREVTSSINDPELMLKLQTVYNTDNKIQHYQSLNKFRILQLSKVGEYNYIGSELKEKNVTWNEIASAIDEMRLLLQ